MAGEVPNQQPMFERAQSPYPSLRLPEGNLGPLAKGKKMAAVAEAWSLATGTLASPTYHCIYQIDDYEVGVRKPGKEADPSFPVPNPNDMLPTIRHRGAFLEYAPGFTYIFEELQKLAVGRSDLALELTGSLLYRAAYMLDHQEDRTGTWRYHPPEDVVRDIERWVPEIGRMPSRVFLHFVEILSWNEDEKYAARGADIGSGVGRTNNLSTCAHIIAVFLGRKSLVRFAGSLARVPAGVAPLTQKSAREVFPLLAGRTTVEASL